MFISVQVVAPGFYTSEILPFIENDKVLFPSHTLHTPEPVMVNNELEHLVDKIIDEKNFVAMVVSNTSFAAGSVKVPNMTYGSPEKSLKIMLPSTLGSHPEILKLLILPSNCKAGSFPHRF
jgi:hypothetical protein